MSTENLKIAILGGGNIGLALAKGLVQSGQYTTGQITITRRNLGALQPFAMQGYVVSSNNAEAVKNADIIVLGVLPQQLNGLLAEIKDSVIEQKQLVISLVTGVSIQDIKDNLGKAPAVVRAMPNTAISVGQSMTCISYDGATGDQKALVNSIFETVGITQEIKEELMTSATALCACGIAFFLRSIRAAMQGGVEIGFHSEEALNMAVQTAKGAAALLAREGAHPEHEIDKVTSPRGCTIAGLNEMEHQGFSSALIKGIRTSAIKAGGLYSKDS
ncbi:pyrroline-5-carboxylate reductase [Solitalea koreensis]|uniref:Pyrroline-5-carboxylate reductase n=1 Tax=Solitalea koreensis TaxID=543615 RepID=A0A521C9L5_9SPHI|nr:pyrroline-5-carboxylate reductase [Solitalea koreensis]SMO56103.1 pyrroline-5-carboxylate reductase [Solitalea koreensis]